MPGLFGLLELRRGARDRDRLTASLDRMAAVLRFRPSDALDTHVDRQAGVAVGRIGPGHASGAAWPIDLDGARVFAFGHPSLGGPDHGLAGQYAALVLGRGGPTLQTDRRGGLPIFCAEWDGALWFAPEVKAILAVRPGAPALDLAAIGTFLASGMVHRGQTFFEAISRLPGGSRLTAASGAPRIEEHFRFAPGSRPRPARHRARLRDELVERLVAAAREAHDDRTVTFLSGGVDSRAVLAAVRRAGHPTPPTVTWGDVERGPRSDVAVAREIAGRLGLRHLEIRREWDGVVGDFERANALLDGRSEMALEHAPELAVMERIGAEGFTRCLRGDEAFGYKGMSHGLEHSWRLVGLRRLRDASDAHRLIAPGARDAMIEASETVFDAIRDRYGDLPPNQAKDGLYFDVRLAGYLQPANYWRQTVFDERNPLLDDAILAFLAEVPEELRLHKTLFEEATRALTRDWPDIPLADEGNLTAPVDHMAPGRPLRAHAEAAARDADSGVWDLIDRSVFRTLLADLDRPSASERSGGARRRLLDAARRGVEVVSAPVAQRIALRVKRGRVREDALIARVLVLKDWHDRSVGGRGGP